MSEITVCVPCAMKDRGVMAIHTGGFDLVGKVKGMFLRRYELRSENNVEDNHTRWGERFQEEKTTRVKYWGKESNWYYI